MRRNVILVLALLCAGCTHTTIVDLPKTLNETTIPNCLMSQEGAIYISLKGDKDAQAHELACAALWHERNPAVANVNSGSVPVIDTTMAIATSEPAAPRLIIVSSSTSQPTMAIATSGPAAPRPSTLPPEDFLVDSLNEVATVSMGWSLAYENSKEGLFIWRLENHGCEGRFAWYMKRIGNELYVDDPMHWRCHVKGIPEWVQSETRRIQEEVKFRWRALVGQIPLQAPSLKTHSPQIRAEGLVESWKHPLRVVAR